MSIEVSAVSDPSTNCDPVYDLLAELLESCTQSADTTDLFSNFSELYDSFEGQGFEESFKKILLYVLSEGKRSTDVSRILRFISESIIHLDNKFKTAATKNGTTEDIDDIVHPLLKRVFKTLIKWSCASSIVVRYRVCQMLFMILTYIQDYGMGEIDMETYENIAQLVESRRLDVSCNVRIHAVLLAKFFQDPSTVNDPVIAGLCWQMQHDPNYRVRQNIVSIIAACEETILPIAKRFLYDKNANVRNAALLHICKRIGPRSFTPYQRIMILHHCFSDPSELVRKNAEQKLIPVWFRACGDKICCFFKLIRIGNESLDDLPFMKELTKVLSKCVKVSQIVEEIELDSTSYLPKLPLSGEKVYLWRHFYTYSRKDQRLVRFVPPLDILIPFISKCFDDCSSEEVENSVFSELILLLMDIMETMGISKCEEVFPMVLNLMRNPFVHHELMPYLVALYLTYSPKEKENVHKDIIEIIEDLLRLMIFTQGQERKILHKCFSIAYQVLLIESSLTTSIKSIKDNLIVYHINSEDEDVKIKAISTLTLYCLLDIKEAKLSWNIFENAVHIESSELRNTLLEGAFDILNCYGVKLFENLNNDGQEKFDETLLTMLTCLEDGEREHEIVTRGTLKIYMEQHSLSPPILANLVILLFHPDDYYTSAKSDLENFFVKFGEFKEGYDCLIKSFLALINTLYDVNKSSALYKINIKSVALKLIEYSKEFEEHRSHSQEKFQDLLVLKLTKKFIKKPWRLSASDLYTVCSKILPKNFDTLLKLKENVTHIRENLQSSVFQQKNPFTKNTEKNFCAYQKKIQIAMNTTPLTEEPSKKNQSSVLKRLNFDSSLSSTKDDSLSRESDVAVDTSTTMKNMSKDENFLQSPIQNESSQTKTPRFKKTSNLSLSINASSETRSTRKTKNSTVTPLPSDTITTKSKSSKIASAAKTTSTKRTTLAEEVNSSPVFKTPVPRKTPSRKRQLDISITKTN